MCARRPPVARPGQRQPGQRFFLWPLYLWSASASEGRDAWERFQELATLRACVTPATGRGRGSPARAGRARHGSSGAALWENIKQKQKRCFSPARLARTHRTGRTHSLVFFFPRPLSLHAESSMRFTPPRARVAVRTARRGARAVDLRQAGQRAPAACRGGGKWWSWTPSGRRRSSRAWRRSSAASSMRLSKLPGGASGSNASPRRMRRPKAGPCPPWPPPSLQRQPLHAKFGCNRRNRQPLAGPRWAAMPTGHLSQVPPAAAGVLCRQQQVQ